MIVLSALYGSRFFIGHFPRQADHAATYTFDQAFLPEGVVHHIRSLTAGARHDAAVYPLTKHQDREAAALFRKLQAESTSDYAFSTQLQKTYVVELIHFITKLAYA